MASKKPRRENHLLKEKRQLKSPRWGRRTPDGCWLLSRAFIGVVLRASIGKRKRSSNYTILKRSRWCKRVQKEFWNTSEYRDKKKKKRNSICNQNEKRSRDLIQNEKPAVDFTVESTNFQITLRPIRRTHLVWEQDGKNDGRRKDISAAFR